MRNPMLFFGSFFLIYGLAVFYLAYRTRQGWSRLAALNNRLWYGLLAFLSSAYFLPRLLGNGAAAALSAASSSTPDFTAALESLFAWGGGLWLAAVYYGTLLFLLADLLWLFCSHFTAIPQVKYRMRAAASTWLLVLSLCSYGAYNSLAPVVTQYEIALPGQFAPFSIAAVSDIHLGRQVGSARLNQLVDLVNAQQADVVVLLGDTIDDDLEPVKRFRGADGLSRLSAAWGVYAVMGNHEYLRQRGEEYAAFLSGDARLHLLRNEVVTLPNGVVLIGREDLSRERNIGPQNSFLSAVKQTLPPQTPAIVLDHQPNRFSEAVAENLPLVLSGHTHVGQIAPNQYAVRRMHPTDYGLLAAGSSKLIVSSGFGTWGPPIRIGNQPEIMLIRLKPQQ